MQLLKLLLFTCFVHSTLTVPRLKRKHDDESREQNNEKLANELVKICPFNLSEADMKYLFHKLVQTCNSITELFDLQAKLVKPNMCKHWLIEFVDKGCQNSTNDEDYYKLIINQTSGLEYLSKLTENVRKRCKNHEFLPLIGLLLSIQLNMHSIIHLTYSLSVIQGHRHADLKKVNSLANNFRTIIRKIVYGMYFSSLNGTKFPLIDAKSTNNLEELVGQLRKEHDRCNLINDILENSFSYFDKFYDRLEQARRILNASKRKTDYMITSLKGNNDDDMTKKRKIELGNGCTSSQNINDNEYAVD